jgi:hypothetical protein
LGGRAQPASGAYPLNERERLILNERERDSFIDAFLVVGERMRPEENDEDLPIASD